MSFIGNVNPIIGPLEDQRSNLLVLIEECTTIAASISKFAPSTEWWPGIVAIGLSIVAIVMHWSKNSYGCK